MNIIDRSIKKNKLLHTGIEIGTHFTTSDANALFEKNLKTQPDDWYYRHNPVTYTINSDSYRAPEFSTVDWANAVVIFGCSNVFGAGVSDEHTISSQLEKLINRPVINLGISGSSIQCAVYNSAILAAGYPCPYAVIQLWSGPDRTILFTDSSFANYGPWMSPPNRFYDEWAQNDNPKITALLYRIISRQIWTNRTHYLEATLFASTAALFKCHDIKTEIENIDLARDLIHPGRHTTAHIAAYFAEQLHTDDQHD